MGLGIETGGGATAGAAATAGWGAAASEGAGLLGGIIGMIGQNRREKRAMRNQEKMMGIQMQNQMQLNQQGKDLALQQWKDTNYSAQRAEMEKAGLNPGLLYGMSGGGGATASAGSGGSAQGGNAPGPQQMPMDMAAMMQLSMIGAQKALTEAQTEKTKAETANIGVGTTGKGLENVGKDIQNKYDQGTLETRIETAKTDYQTKVAEFTSANAQAKIDETTYKQKIQQIENETITSALTNEAIKAGILKTEAGTDLDRQQIEESKAKINNWVQENAIHWKHLSIEGKQYKLNQLQNQFNTSDAAKLKQWAEAGGKVVEGITQIKTPGKPPVKTTGYGGYTGTSTK